jgi:hypothetical protein
MYRAQPARSQVFIFFYRAQPARTVEIMFYFCRAAAARCWILIRPRRAEPARQSTSPVGTVQNLRGGRMLEFCRADPVMRFVF